MKNRNVVVFGGSGFLGSHVADELSTRGYRVIIYDLKPYERLKNNQKMFIGNIDNETKVKQVMQGADIVYNFSAVSDIEEAAQRPIDTIKINILGNSNLLNIACQYKIKRFIFASSLYVCGKSGSFYRVSKYSSELLIESFQEVFGLDYTILRYGSLYGKFADERNWIYTILRDALIKKKIIRHGDGEELREYIHVEDAARISVDILSEKYKNSCVIVAGNHSIKIKDLLIMIKEIMNNNIAIKYLKSKQNYHYKITPYSFMPKIGRKIISNYYIDFGQGIIDCLNYIHQENAKMKSYNKEGG